jgi:MOSC domain-containing protein YiiM
MNTTRAAHLVSVSLAATHEFSKTVRSQINLIAGLGVEGDAHCGVTVKHRSRVARDPTQPNLRQVHLIHCELFDELRANGFTLRAGDVGENLMTKNIALLDLPTDTELWIGESAVIKVTGLRNPCAQLDTFRNGLMAALLDRDPSGELIRKAGVMAVVVRSGVVRAGDAIVVHRPALPHRRLVPV